eukprot:XP_001952520.2 PREDICTED: glycoprotein 3-alpha-L-fucosyltransferase A [Acyrthosiphon pisum]
MPRAPRARIGRRTANATRMYNRKQQDNTPERSQTHAQEQRNALSNWNSFVFLSYYFFLNDDRSGACAVELFRSNPPKTQTQIVRWLFQHVIRPVYDWLLTVKTICGFLTGLGVRDTVIIQSNISYLLGYYGQSQMRSNSGKIHDQSTVAHAPDSNSRFSHLTSSKNQNFHIYIVTISILTVIVGFFRKIWILFNTESPYSTSLISDANVFNWTANYRWDSDVPRTYGYFIRNNSPLPPDGGKNYSLNKTKKVAWFVSNCNPNSNRTIYANELAKHITVDVYGGCGTNKCPQTKHAGCFQMLKNDYKFYLCFENSHCVYYVTEKLFVNALSNDVLPIVMGPKRSDYELMAPNYSFIHVDDFGSPKELAEYLHLLDKDHQLYNEYFRWKGSGTVTRDTRFYCRLCAMLHDTKRAPRHYEDINEWWRGLGTCQT